MAEFYTPGDYSTDEVASAAKMNRDFYANMLFVHTQVPQRATLFHDESTVTNGNAISGTIDTSQIFMTYFQQSAAAVDDVFTHTVRLGAGVYQLKFTGQQYNSGGMFSVDLGGQSVGDGFDTYSAATVRNVDLLGTSYVEILRAGVHTITVTVYDKNGSSGGYGLRITTIEFIPKVGDL